MKRKKWNNMIGLAILILPALLITLLTFLPQKEPEAQETKQTVELHMKILDTTYKTETGLTKEFMFFGLDSNRFPALYCVNIGERVKLNQAATVSEEVEERVKAVLRWGYQENATREDDKKAEDDRNKAMWKTFSVIPYDKDKFRLATQLAVWMILNKDGVLEHHQKRDTEPVNKEIDYYKAAIRIYEKAKKDIGKELVGPRVIGASWAEGSNEFDFAKGIIKIGPFDTEVNAAGFDYQIGILDPVDLDKDPFTQFYQGKFPKGFKIIAGEKTELFVAATKYTNGNMDDSEIKALNQERLENLTEYSNYTGEEKKRTLKCKFTNEDVKLAEEGTAFYLQVAADCSEEDMKLLEELKDKINVKVENLPDPKKDKSYFYDVKKEGWQNFARMNSVMDSETSEISFTVNKSVDKYILRLAKYPSDAAIAGFTFDETDPEKWEKQLYDTVKTSPKAVKEEKVSAAVESAKQQRLNNPQYATDFTAYKKAIQDNDTTQAEALLIKYPSFGFYAQNDPSHDEAEEILTAYYKAEVQKAEGEYKELGSVSNPMFTAIYEQYKQDVATGGVESPRIDAKFVIRGEKNAFSDTSYAKKAIKGDTYDYIKVTTKNGILEIPNIKPGNYLIGEQQVMDKKYQLTGSSKLYTKLDQTKKITSIAEGSKVNFQIEGEGQEFEGYPVVVKKGSTGKVYTYNYVCINEPFGRLIVSKVGLIDGAAPGADKIKSNAVFRLVGTSPGASYPMKQGQENDPNANGGYNFATLSGSKEITGLLPGTYRLYEYRSDQIYTDAKGNQYQMDSGYIENDTDPNSDKSKLLLVTTITVEGGTQATSSPIYYEAVNLTTPAFAFIKMDGDEFDANWKDYQTNTEKKQQLLTLFTDAPIKLRKKLDVRFKLKGIGADTSYPEGKMFETSGNAVKITGLKPGLYEVEEDSIINDVVGEYIVNRKKYEITIDRSHTVDNPYLIVHPNYINQPVFAALTLTKMDEGGRKLDGVHISCASFPEDYYLGQTNSELTQKKDNGSYEGYEYYFEGIVNNGVVSFQGIPAQLDGDNVKSWVHLHELKGIAGYSDVPFDSEGNPWNDYQQQCPVCQETGRENATGKDVKLDVQSFVGISGNKHMKVINQSEIEDWAWLTIEKTNMDGTMPIPGAIFELWTNPNLGTSRKVPVGLVTDGTTGEAILTTLEPGSLIPSVPLETDANGMIRIKITKAWLSQGQLFLVRECFVPEPFFITTTDTRFQLAEKDHRVLTIKNEATYVEGYLQIKKLAAGDAKVPLAGAVFDLYETILNAEGMLVKDTSKEVRSDVSDEQGMITFSNLEFGKAYIAEEVQAPSGYSILESSRNIVITAQKQEDLVPVEVINQEERIQIEILKKDEKSGQGLAGAEFWIRDSRDHVVEALITDETGHAISSRLRRQDYTLEEITAPFGYELPYEGGKRKVLVIEGKTLYSYEFTNKKIQASIQIQKVSKDPESQQFYSLAGSAFQVKKKGSDEILDTLVIGDLGLSQLSKRFDLGTYLITEVAASDGYYLDKDGDGIPDEIGYTKEIQLSSQQTLVVEMENSPVSARLQILKRDKKEGSLAVAGVVFSIYRTKDDSYVESVTTDLDGIAMTGTLYQGEYYFVEEFAPADYWIDKTPHPLIINQDNMGVITKIIENEAVELNIRIHKTSSKGTNLEGVGFTLFDHENQPVLFQQVDEDGIIKGQAEFYTNEDGILIFPTKVPYGTYTLKETKTPPKYKKAEDLTFTIDNQTHYVEIDIIGKTVTHEIINYPKIAELVFDKIDDDTKTPIAGVEFLLECQENNYSESFTTDQDGKIKVTGLEMGTYVWTEKKPAEGYPVGNEPVTGEVEITEDGKTYYIFVKNKKEKKGVAKVLKLDKTTGESLAEAEFQLSDETGILETKKTNAEGLLLFENLTPKKTYRITETKAPEGYLLPDPAWQEVTPEEGETVIVTFRDESKTITVQTGLRILKVDKATGAFLQGAEFELYDDTGKKVGEGTSRADGSISFPNLIGGKTYTVKEVKAPEGYTLPNPDHQQVTTKDGETVLVTFEDEKITANVQVKKLDKATRQPLAGAVFELYNQAGTKVDQGTSGSDGTITFSKLELNKTYTVKEVTAPEGYTLPKPDSQQFTTKEGEVATVIFEDEKKTTSVQVKKLDKATKQPLAGAVFELYNQAGTKVDQGTSGSDGTITFSKLELNKTYTVKEVTAPEGYTLPKPDSQQITTKEGEVITVTFEDEKKTTSVQVKKLDKATKQPLAGAVFELYNQAGTKVDQGTSGSDGTITFSKLELNKTYTVKEVTAPEGYTLPNPSSQRITTVEGETVTVTFEDEKKTTSIQVKKLDKTTKQPLAGAVFELYQAGVKMDQGTSGSYGTIFFMKLELNQTYTVKEVEAPAGYTLPNPNSQQITTKEGEIAIVTFEDEKKTTSIKVKKLDKTTKQPLDGAVFELYLAGVKVDQGTSVHDGTITFTKVEIDRTYTIKEVTAPEGYTLPVPNSQQITTQEGEVATVTFEDEKKTTSIQVKKLDKATKQPLAGAVFELYQAGMKVDEGTSGSDGTISFTKLSSNQTYTIKEVTAPKGYTLPAPNSQQITTKEGEIVVVIFEDEKKTTSVQVKKLDKITKQPLAGAVFELYNQAGEKLDEGTSGSNGTISFTKLELNQTYTIKEVTAPEGYTLPTPNSQQITTQEGEVATVTFEDEKKTTSIQVKKLDKTTKQPLAGAVFELYQAGIKVDEGTSGSDGSISFMKLSSNQTYTIKEVTAPKGYTLPIPNSQQITTKDGEVVIVTFEDEKKTTSVQVKKLDKVTKQPLAGAVFELYNQAGERLDQGTSGSDGMISFRKLELNQTYTIMEVTAPEGYTLPYPNTQRITTEEGEVATVTFEDEKKTTSVQVKKLDKATKQPLAGAVFELYSQAGVMVDEGTSRSDGTILFSKLVSNQIYTIKEVTAPVGYTLPTPNSQQITTKEGEIVTVTFEDEKKTTSVQVKKLDKTTKQPLAGAVFELYNQAGERLDEGTSGSDGMISFTKLDINRTYIIKEVTAPEGYTLPIPNSQPINTREGEVATATFEDEKITTSIQIKKLDKVTKQPLSGAIFELYNQAGVKVDEGSSTSDGTILFTKLARNQTYTVKEVTAPKGYTLPTPNSQQITTKEGETVLVTFEDERKKTTVKVRKEDLETGNPLADAYFILYDEKGNQLEKGRSNQDGMILFTQLEVGKVYTVEERTAPVGYEPAHPNRQQITTKEGETALVVFKNKQKKKETKLQILKLDKKTKLPLEGAFFELRTLEGSLVASGTTDKDGIWTPVGAIAGTTYLIKEVRPPKGYLLPNPNEKMVTMQKDQTTVVTFEDEKEENSSVLVKKLDQTTRLPLAGATFELSLPNGVFLDRGISKEDGTITFDELKPGVTYVVTEVSAPVNYNLANPSSQQITTKAGETVSVFFYNTRKPDNTNLRVIKVEEETEIPLAGAYFELLDEKGTKLEGGYSKADGSLSFQKLESGKSYIVREVTPPEGYLLPDKREQQIVALADKTITVVFRDKKNEEGMLQIRKEDQQTGQLLAGAVFRITSQEGFSLVVTTPEHGIAVVRSLQQGEYQIEEIVPPVGYQLAKPAKQTIYFVSGQTMYVTFRNQKLESGEGTFLLKKVDAETKQPIPGVIFSILNREKQELTRGITNENGMLTLSLLEGTYYCQEMQPAEGYQLENQMHSFVIRKGETVTITVVNTKKQGQLMLQKIDSVTKEALQGAVFAIYDVAGTKLMTQTTDETGTCRFILPAGTYFYEEVSAPPSYFPVIGKKPFQITEQNQIITETIPNRKENGDGMFVLNKLDAQDKTNLAGCTFAILNEQGEEIERGITDEQGIYTSKLPKGSYFYQELFAPEGYFVNSIPQPFQIEEDGQVIYKTVTNLKKEQPSPTPEEPSGTMILTKQDINNDQILLPNTLITIRSKETGTVVMQKRTNEQGVAEFTLSPGSYTYQETEAPEGYLLDEGIYDFEIRANGEIVKAVMTDLKIPEFWLLKVDFNTNHPIEGCTFRILNADKEEIMRGITDLEGYFKTPLLPGIYYYEELEPAPGYEKKKQIQQFQVKEGDQRIERKVTNKKIKDTVDLPKTGDSIIVSSEASRAVSLVIKAVLTGGILAVLLFVAWKRKKKF